MQCNEGFKVGAPIMSRPVLWVIHTNKCESVQLLGQHIVPYETYHPINCILTYCIFMLVHAYFCIESMHKIVGLQL